MSGRRRLVQGLGRFGYAARGAVYLLSGVFTLMAVAEFGNADETGTRGVLDAFAEWPLGGVWLGVVAFGLLAFVLWRLAQSVFDADGRGSDLEGLAKRAGMAVSGVAYAGLAFAAFQGLTGLGEFRDEESQARANVHKALEFPLGDWILVAFGACIILGGLGNMIRPLTHDFRKQLRKDAGRLADVTVWLGRIGYPARGVAIAALGWFFLRAGLEERPERARNIGGALEALGDIPFGGPLLTAVALGLILFGLFGLAQSAARRMHAPAAMLPGVEGSGGREGRGAG